MTQETAQARKARFYSGYSERRARLESGKHAPYMVEAIQVNVDAFERVYPDFSAIYEARQQLAALAPSPF